MVYRGRERLRKIGRQDGARAEIVLYHMLRRVHHEWAPSTTMGLTYGGALQDAAAVLRLVAPEYFAPRWYGRHSVCGGHREWLQEDDEDAQAASNLVSLKETNDALVQLCNQGIKLAAEVRNPQIGTKSDTVGLMDPDKYSVGNAIAPELI